MLRIRRSSMLIKLLTPLLFSVIVTLPTTGSLNAAPASSTNQPYATSSAQHFHPKGKLPSKFTLEILNKARETMPCSDTRDFEESEKGFIAPLKPMVIKVDAGHVAWDIERYQFFNEGREFDSQHKDNDPHIFWKHLGRTAG